MKFVDYHVHSNNSCDGKSTLFDMCKKAIQYKIEEIGISEHMIFGPKKLGYGFFDYDKYTSEIVSAKKIFKKDLKIWKGVEIDYQNCYENEIRDWLKDKEFEFIIGSVHYIGKNRLGNKFVEKNDLKKIYEIYFKEVTFSIESHLFDVIGHLDYVRQFVKNKKTAFKSLGLCKDIEKILEDIVEKKIFLEINSRGLRGPYKDVMPRKNIVKDFVRFGGKLISIGSDAHSIQDFLKVKIRKPEI
jgi:histidinol-phosphatase (PHP family)